MRELSTMEIAHVSGGTINSGALGDLFGRVGAAGLGWIVGVGVGSLKGGVAGGSTGGIFGVGAIAAAVTAIWGGVMGGLQGATYGLVNGWDKTVDLYSRMTDLWADPRTGPVKV